MPPCCSACQQRRRIRQTAMALVSQHVCKRAIYAYHTSAYRALLHPAAHWIWQERLSAFLKPTSPVFMHFFLMLCANRISKLQLNPRLRNCRSEAPQPGLMLSSSMYLLSSTLIIYFSMRISSARHIASVHNIYFNEHKGEMRTIGCI